MKNQIKSLVVVMLFSTFCSSISRAQGTAFSYNGRLDVNGMPANGNYDFLFSLFTASTGGIANSGPITNSSIAVSNGLFITTLDFGAGVFTGTNEWLGIRVSPSGSNIFTELTPRQPVTPTPYAIYSENAGNLTGSLPAGSVGNGELAHSSITVIAGFGLGGGGTVPLGGATALVNAGVLSVTGNSDITATTASGAVTLGDTATNANTPNTIVKRDASGNFSAGSLGLSGILNLPMSPTIYSGPNLLLYADANSNFFAGPGAGNLTMSGIENTANGANALANNTSGEMNTAIGVNVLLSNTTGFDNTADGFEALLENTNGSENTAHGMHALASNTSGRQNTADGKQALFLNTTGDDNTATGFEALDSNTTGFGNTASGIFALDNNTAGSANTAVGSFCLDSITSGINNIALGAEAGSNFTNSESDNIDIGNWGVAGESGVIRIGTSGTQSNTFIAGVINGNGGGLTNLSVANLAGTVGNNQLANSSITINAGSGLTGGGTVALGTAITLKNAGVLSVTGNSDITATTANGAVTLGDTATNTNTPGTIVKRDASGNFSAGSITLSSVLNLPALPTIYSGPNLLLRADASGNFFVGPDSGNLTTSGADNTVDGFQSFLSNTSGSYNTANGALALNHNTEGSGNTADGFNALSGNTSGTENTACGIYALAFNTIGLQNTATGGQALFVNSTGNDNTAAGFEALDSNTSGSGNTANGVFSLVYNSNGSGNTAYGDASLEYCTSGNNNTALGGGAGSNFTNSESDNIDIGNFGVAGESGVIRIGSSSTQTNTFIAGIYGNTAASGVPVYITPSGQLGTLTSSARFKQDIESMNEASDVLLSLRPVTFRYNSTIDPHGTPQFGLVAEDVEKVDPDLVAHDPHGTPYTVRYEAVNAMLLNEFLKEHKTVEEQSKEIETLAQTVADLKQMVRVLAEKGLGHPTPDGDSANQR